MAQQRERERGREREREKRKDYKYKQQKQEPGFLSHPMESMKLFILVAMFRLGLAQHDPHTKHGRTAIVHLFEWRWADIAAECERFLGPNGFGGVQVRRAECRCVANSWSQENSRQAIELHVDNAPGWCA